jgi:hypothetical protein
VVQQSSASASFSAKGNATITSEPPVLPASVSKTEAPAASLNHEPPAAPAPASASTNLALFDPPQLFAGENGWKFEHLAIGMDRGLKPADIVEELWVHDIVLLAWENLRLRRLQTALLASTACDILMEILYDTKNPGALVAGWAMHQQAAIEEVDNRLRRKGLTVDTVLAKALAKKLDEFERIDRMIMTAEARRNAALHEIERHRATLGQRLRRETPQAQEVEFEVIEADPDAGESAP